MNFHLPVLAVLSCCLAPAFAQTQVGYTTGNMGRTTVFHYGNNVQQGMAIRLSHDKLQALKGHKITAINTAFGAANGVKDKQATLFLATSLTAEPFSQQSYTIASANKWYQIALDAPYTITGDEPELLVGYRLTTSTSNISEVLQADKTDGSRGCSYAWDGSSWNDLYGTGFGSPNLRLVFDDQFSFSDAMLSEVDFSEAYYMADNEYNHTTHVFNFGTQPITRIDVTVQMGSDTQTVTYDGLNIAQYGTYSFALPPLTASASGATEVEVSVSVNGQQDACPEDNAFTSSAFFYPAGNERNIFVEEFTGMTCVNCPAGARTLHSAIEQCGLPCVTIMHHAGYAPDYYSADADWDYTMYYGSQNVFAPAAMINRLTVPGVSDVPVMNVGLQLLLDAFDYAAQHQPYVSLGLESKFNAGSREVEVTLDVASLNQLPGATLLNVYLVQDSIKGYQQGAGTNYSHNGVLRRVLTGNSWGLLLPDDFSRGDQQQWGTSFQLPDSIMSDYWTDASLSQSGFTRKQVTLPTDPENMRIVAYVASYNPNNIKHNVVYNCIEVPLVNGKHVQTGMPQSEALESLPAQPTVVSGIHDLSGRRIDTPSSPGFYIINGKKVLVR